MLPRFRQSGVRFEVIDDHLVRTVTARDGRCYVHRCSHESYRAAAYAFETCGGQGLKILPLASDLDLPSTQVAVALDFLKERGCVVTRHRSNYPASGFVYEDALIEWHALADGQQDQEPSGKTD